MPSEGVEENRKGTSFNHENKRRAASLSDENSG